MNLQRMLDKCRRGQWSPEDLDWDVEPRAMTPRPRWDEWKQEGMELAQVEHADDAFTSVYNRGYWFYIDDRDLITKRTFGVLQILLSLTDSGDTARGPVVTIGN